MEGGGVSVSERRHRGWRGQHLHSDMLGTLDGRPPSFEGKRLQVVACHKVGIVRSWEDDNSARRHHIQIAGPPDPVSRTVQTTTLPMPLRVEHPIQLSRQKRAVRFCRDGHRISKRPILGSPAVPTRSMTGGQAHGIVEKEQRGPRPRSIERLVEALELETTDDPKWAVVMTSQPPVVINETAAIPGEHATCRNGVKISPRVNPVPTCHPAPNLSRTQTLTRSRSSTGSFGQHT